MIEYQETDVSKIACKLRNKVARRTWKGNIAMGIRQRTHLQPY